MINHLHVLLKIIGKYSIYLVFLAGSLAISGCGNVASELKDLGKSVSDATPASVLSVNSVSVNESAGTVSIAVSISVNPTSSETVDYATVDGTATSASDYTATSGTLTWAAGDSATKTITVPITDDAITEVDQTFLVNLSAASGADLDSVSSSTVTIVDDDGPPTLTITKKTGQVSPTNTLPIEFTVTFSKAINAATFTTADITNTGTAAGITWNIVNVSALVYTIEVTASGNGTLIPQIANASIEDLAGNLNSGGATTSSDTVIYDSIAPGAFNITGATGGTDVTANAFLTSGVTVTANWGASAGAASYDVVIRNAADSADICATQNSTSTSYVFIGCVLIEGTSYRIKVTAKDAAGNQTAATNDGYSFTVDTIAPTVTFTKKVGQANATNTLPVEFTATFSEDITGFTSADISNTGTATGVTWTITSVSASVYTVSATVSGNGTLIPQIASSSVTDAAGHTNASAQTSSDTITYDTAAPSAPSALALLNPATSPGTDGTPEIRISGVVVGDTVRLFTDACTTLVGSATVSSGTTVDVTSSDLGVAGNYTFYANSTDPAGNASTCSVATVAYVYGTLGAFTVTGIQGASDAVNDANLNGGLNPKVIWGTSTDATSYDVTIYESDGTTVKCATQNTSSTEYDFSSCSLTAGTTYRARVIAKAASYTNVEATNSPYSFFVNRAPTVTASGPWYVLSGGSITIQAQYAAAPAVGTAEDADGDTLSFSAVGVASAGTATNNTTNISYSPGSNTGVQTFTFTVSDGRGATVSGTITVHVVTAFTWTGGAADGAWSSASNWCGSINTNKTGCANNGAAPSNASTASHIAIFDGTCQSSCNATTNTGNYTMYGLVMSSSYAGTVTQAAGRTMTIGLGNFTQAGGTFTGGNSDITVTGIVTLSGGTFTGGTGTFNIETDMGVSGTTTVLNVGAGASVTFGTTTRFYIWGWTLHGVIDFAGTSLTMQNVILQGRAGGGHHTGIQPATGKKIIVAGNFTQLSGPVIGDWDLHGNLVATAGGGPGTITFNGTGNQTYSGNTSGGTANLVINKASGTVTEAGGSTGLILGSFNLAQGSFTGPSGTMRIEYWLPGSVGTAPIFTVAAGTTFTAAATTHFNFWGFWTDGIINIGDASLSFNNLTVQGNYTGGYTPNLIVNSGKTLTVNGDLSNVSGGISGTFVAKGNWSVSNALGGSATVLLNGTGVQTLTFAATFSSTGTVEIDKASGTVELASNVTFGGVGQDLYLKNGTVNMNNYNLTVSNSSGTDNVLTLDAGTVINRGTGVLTYESLVNNGGTIN